ncbi:hypothetical protein [Richelia sinica]|nr:hypothetical protein [Richelia sinica]MBD2667141.1 hypothetical protein [Richelia sinica FACHB-800]
MNTTEQSNSTSLKSVLERIFTIRRITRQDQQIMMTSFLSEEGLSEYDRMEINKVFDALKSGFIKVVD